MSPGAALFDPSTDTHALTHRVKGINVADPVVAGSQPRPKPKSSLRWKPAPQKAGLPMQTQFTQAKQNGNKKHEEIPCNHLLLRCRGKFTLQKNKNSYIHLHQIVLKKCPSENTILTTRKCLASYNESRNSEQFLI